MKLSKISILAVFAALLASVPAEAGRNRAGARKRQKEKRALKIAKTHWSARLPQFRVASKSRFLDGWAHRVNGVWWTTSHTGPGVHNPITLKEARQRYDRDAKVERVNWRHPKRDAP